MGKKVVYTKITPLPSNVPRQLALDMLHSHTEVIELNPLVTGVKPTTAPRDAAADEFFSNWYEINEIITWGFGLKKKIMFKGVFHDQPWGLQAHVYAPMGVDLRNKYRIGGNQPGEPRETRELGLDTPQDGLYLREDHEITCSVPLTASFVKKEMKASTAVMVTRMTRKAELLEEGKLHAMFENGMLKTAKPSLQPTFSDRPPPSPISDQGPGSPALSSVGSMGPNTDEKGFGRYQDIVNRQNSHRQSQYTPVLQHQQPVYNNQQGRPDYKLSGVPEVFEVEGSYYHPQQSPPLHQNQQMPQYQPAIRGQSFRAELPGDNTLYPPAAQTTPDLRPASQYSQQSYQAYASPNPNQQSYSSSPQPSPRLPQQQQQQQQQETNSGNFSQHPSHRGSSGPSSTHHSPNLNQQPPHHQQQKQQQQQQQQQQPTPADPTPNAKSAHVAEWQRNVSTAASSSDPNSLPSSRHTSLADHDADHQAQRFSNLSIQHSPATSYASSAPPPIPVRGERRASGGFQGAGGGAGLSKCPVCAQFEGDEAAVSHHVTRAHFT